MLLTSSNFDKSYFYELIFLLSKHMHTLRNRSYNLSIRNIMKQHSHEEFEPKYEALLDTNILVNAYV